MGVFSDAGRGGALRAAKLSLVMNKGDRKAARRGKTH